jgi:apolipoprotein N-acyltransferase
VLPAAVVMTAVLGYGYARISDMDARPDARVALIQGCIDAKLKSDPKMYERIFSEYYNLSIDALGNAEQRIDLIVWPESMFPSPLVDLGPKARKPDHLDCSDKAFADMPETSRRLIAENTAMDFGTPTLLGLNTHYIRSDGVDIFNSAVLVMPDGQFSPRYDKMHLVMFGEYVPFADTFPWLRRFTPLPLNVVAGKQPEVFELGSLRMAPTICYESVLSRVIRRQVNELRRQGKEPNVLVNITNDGWYWGSSELDLHLICGVFRAVECRKPLLIAANTGFSAWIDADGRIRRRGPRHAKGVVMAEVSVDDRHSWYLTSGDWPAGICLAACAFFALVGLWKRRTTQEPQGTPRAV